MSARKTMTLLTAVVLAATATTVQAQALFRDVAPIELTLTTNLRDLLRERDSTELRWFGTMFEYREGGEVRRVPVDLRARGHFRRQARNCSFPPIALRAARGERDGTVLQGNPRLKIVTPCRPGTGDYQQYILVEYMIYRMYEAVMPVHHRTRLARITYRDSTERVKPIEVTAFFLEVEEEVADEHDLTFTEATGALWDDVEPEALNRLSLFEYWVGNTDWSLAALHNISLFRTKEGNHVPVAYDFDWSGAVNARYSFPNPKLGIRTVRDRLHRGPCRTAEQWAPTIAHFRSRRAAIDSIWAASAPGLDVKRRDEVKQWLDSFWLILGDERRFKREVIDECQPHGN
jgi:hypothetical protein